MKSGNETSREDTISVFFDPQIFLAQEKGGISRYFSELISVFEQKPELGVRPRYFKLPMRLNQHASMLLGQKPLKASKIARGLLLALYSVAAWFPKTSLVHSTFYFWPYLLVRKKLVSTLYDMLPERFGNAKPKFPVAKRAFLENADGVISISSTSLEELEKLWGVSPKCFAITHLGASSFFKQSTESILYLPEKFLLLVGQRGGYKRGDWAFEVALSLEENEFLVVVGPAATTEEINWLESSSIASQVLFMSADDSDLPEIYSRASALLFPSELEGFGLPIFESFACGTPVVMFDNAINRELVPQSHSHLLAKDFEEFLETSLRMLRSSKPTDLERQTLVSLGRQFSWDKTAKETADFYRSFILRTTEG